MSLSNSPIDPINPLDPISLPPRSSSISNPILQRPTSLPPLSISLPLTKKASLPLSRKNQLASSLSSNSNLSSLPEVQNHIEKLDNEERDNKKNDKKESSSGLISADPPIIPQTEQINNELHELEKEKNEFNLFIESQTEMKVKRVKEDSQSKTIDNPLCFSSFYNQHKTIFPHLTSLLKISRIQRFLNKINKDSLPTQTLSSNNLSTLSSPLHFLSVLWYYDLITFGKSLLSLKSRLSTLLSSYQTSCALSLFQETLSQFSKLNSDFSILSFHSFHFFNLSFFHQYCYPLLIDCFSFILFFQCTQLVENILQPQEKCIQDFLAVVSYLSTLSSTSSLSSVFFRHSFNTSSYPYNHLYNPTYNSQINQFASSSNSIYQLYLNIPSKYDILFFLAHSQYQKGKLNNNLDIPSTLSPLFTYPFLSHSLNYSFLFYNGLTLTYNHHFEEITKDYYHFLTAISSHSTLPSSPLLSFSSFLQFGVCYRLLHQDRLKWLSINSPEIVVLSSIFSLLSSISSYPHHDLILKILFFRIINNAQTILSIPHSYSVNILNSPSIKQQSFLFYLIHSILSHPISQSFFISGSSFAGVLWKLGIIRGKIIDQLSLAFSNHFDQIWSNNKIFSVKNYSTPKKHFQISDLFQYLISKYIEPYHGYFTSLTSDLAFDSKYILLSLLVQSFLRSFFHYILNKKIKFNRKGAQQLRSDLQHLRLWLVSHKCIDDSTYLSLHISKYSLAIAAVLEGSILDVDHPLSDQDFNMWKQLSIVQ